MRATLAGCLLLAACTADIPENVFPCSDGCPPSFVCRDEYCWRTAAGADAGPGVDAGPEGDGGPARDGGPGLEDGGPDAGGCVGGCAEEELCRADGVCVQCLVHEDCTDPASSRCDATSGTCMPCLVHGDCTDPASSRCDAMSGTCTPCRNSSECAQPGLGVCHDAGECVECTNDDPAACAGNPCTSANTCSAYGPEQRVCEPCDTDENCEDMNEYCVPMFYMGTLRGGYCLADNTVGCAQPFSRPTARTSLSGRTDTYCGINETSATCEAVLALIDGAACPGGGDVECPLSGQCRTVGVEANRCTYPCEFTLDCPAVYTCVDGRCG